MGHERSEAIVGSGNLSEGGMVGNVECGMYTSEPTTVAALEQWFDLHWALGSLLERSHDLYIRKYRELEQFRKDLRARLRDAKKEIADEEASWRKNLSRRHSSSSGASSGLVAGGPFALLAGVKQQPLDQALDELRDGKPEVYFGTDANGAGPARNFELRGVYFMVTRKSGVTYRAEFVGITPDNPVAKRLVGNESKESNYYYGFRNLIKLEAPVPLSDLRYRNGHPIPDNWMGCNVIRDPDR